MYVICRNINGRENYLSAGEGDDYIQNLNEAWLESFEVMKKALRKDLGEYIREVEIKRVLGRVI